MTLLSSTTPPAADVKPTNGSALSLLCLPLAVARWVPEPFVDGHIYGSLPASLAEGGDRILSFDGRGTQRWAIL
jgi:hypothetical protein